MKMIWIIAAVSIAFTVGALFILFNGKVEVQPVRILNPTNFASPAEIGAITFRRFWQELHTEKLVVLGSSTLIKDSDLVWKGFLAVARKYDVKFTHTFAQEGLREILPAAQPLNWEKVQIALAGEGLVLVHVVATDKMWKETIERTRGGLFIFQSLLPLTPAERESLMAACDEKSQDFQISCKALQTLNGGKKKKFDPDKLTAVIEKQGPTAHLLFIHEQ